VRNSATFDEYLTTCKRVARSGRATSQTSYDPALSLLFQVLGDANNPKRAPISTPKAIATPRQAAAPARGGEAA
jgi:hypothetical protein